jgi:hypothetical protein
MLQPLVKPLVHTGPIPERFDRLYPELFAKLSRLIPGAVYLTFGEIGQLQLLRAQLSRYLLTFATLNSRLYTRAVSMVYRSSAVDSQPLEDLYRYAEGCGVGQERPLEELFITPRDVGGEVSPYFTRLLFTLLLISTQFIIPDKRHPYLISIGNKKDGVDATAYMYGWITLLTQLDTSMRTHVLDLLDQFFRAQWNVYPKCMVKELKALCSLLNSDAVMDYISDHPLHDTITQSSICWLQ